METRIEGNIASTPHLFSRYQRRVQSTEPNSVTPLSGKNVERDPKKKKDEPSILSDANLNCILNLTKSSHLRVRQLAQSVSGSVQLKTDQIDSQPYYGLSDAGWNDLSELLTLSTTEFISVQDSVMVLAILSANIRSHEELIRGVGWVTILKLMGISSIQKILVTFIGNLAMNEHMRDVVTDKCLNYLIEVGSSNSKCSGSIASALANLTLNERQAVLIGRTSLDLLLIYIKSSIESNLQKQLLRASLNALANIIFIGDVELNSLIVDRGLESIVYCLQANDESILQKVAALSLIQLTRIRRKLPDVICTNICSVLSNMLKDDTVDDTDLIGQIVLIIKNLCENDAGVKELQQRQAKEGLLKRCSSSEHPEMTSDINEVLFKLITFTDSFPERIDTPTSSTSSRSTSPKSPSRNTPSPRTPSPIFSPVLFEPQHYSDWKTASTEFREDSNLSDIRGSPSRQNQSSRPQTQSNVSLTSSSSSVPTSNRSTSASNLRESRVPSSSLLSELLRLINMDQRAKDQIASVLPTGSDASGPPVESLESLVKLSEQKMKELIGHPKYGFIPALVGLLNVDNEEIQFKTLDLLSTVSYNYEINQSILGTTDVLRHLIKLLKNAKLANKAAQLVASMSFNNKKLAKELSLTLLQVVSMLDQPNASNLTKQSAALAIHSLCTDKDNQDLLLKRGGVDSLIGLLNSSDVSSASSLESLRSSGSFVSSYAASLCSALTSAATSNSKVQSLICKNRETLARVVLLLKSDDPGTVTFACSLVKELGRSNDKGQELLTKEGVVEELSHVLACFSRSEPLELRVLYSCIGAIWVYSQSKKRRKLFVSLHCMQYLEAISRMETNETIAEASKQALKLLAQK